jgi:hypothetical protein
VHASEVVPSNIDAGNASLWRLKALEMSRRRLCASTLTSSPDSEAARLTRIFRSEFVESHTRVIRTVPPFRDFRI